MKALLIILALVVLVVLGLGLYRGWFRISSHNDSQESNVTLSVDKDKVEADKDSAVEEAQRLGHKAVDKISPPPEEAQR
jgi:predicted negative regulator of RcsB-dependent stress response